MMNDNERDEPVAETRPWGWDIIEGIVAGIDQLPARTEKRQRLINRLNRKEARQALINARRVARISTADNGQER